MNYAFYTTVLVVEELFERRYLKGVGDKTEFHRVSMGWFISMKGSYEKLHVGMDKPEVNVGDVIKITIEKVQDA